MRILAVAALLALAAGCTGIERGPLERASSGGGSVLDAPGYFSAIAADATQADNGGGSAVVLSGTIQDNNSESDVAWIRGLLDGTSPISANHSVTAAERLAASEPAAFGADGFKVWTGASGIDGALMFKWRVAIPTTTMAGSYGLWASEGNPGATAWSARLPLVIGKTANVAIAAAPVSWNGAEQSGAAWGAWTAAPGATSVDATNWLKLTNLGPLSRPKVVVDFNELAFVGAADAAYTVPIANNVAFAWWDDATPSASAPSEGSYGYATSPDGSVTAQFENVGDIIYVGYRVLALPRVLSNQSYVATYTATDAGGDDGAASLPDLIVERIVPSDAAPASGQAITFTVTIRNVGAASVANATLPIWLAYDSTLLETLQAPGPLAPGAAASVTSSAMTVRHGSHTITARADPSGYVAETAEGNNDLTLSISPGATSGGTR